MGWDGMGWDGMGWDGRDRRDVVDRETWHQKENTQGQLGIISQSSWGRW